MVTTAAKISTHVTEDTHLQGKRLEMARMANTVLFQNDKLIDEKAWEGIVGDTCVICNVDIDDYFAHTMAHSHFVKVIKSTVTIDEDSNIYRKASITVTGDFIFFTHI